MEYWLVIRWLAVYLLLFGAGVPIAAVLCPRLSNRGVGVALPLALACVGLPVYWIGQLTFGWVAIVGGLLSLACVHVVVWVRGSVEIERRPVVEAAIVFTLAFFGLVLVRAVDPGIHPAGGEKFLDYGLLRSVLRASSLPPEDFWFAGESVQYYYGGHLLSAVLSVLTSTSARYSYNLALAGWYAMVVTAVYGLAGSLGTSFGVSRRRSGVFGVFFVGVASNLQTLVRLLLWLFPDQTAASVAEWLGVPLTGLSVSPAKFSYWNASRIIPGVPSDPDSYRIATEFPLFSWLNGDLHAHMMSTPFMLAVATLCFSYYRNQTADESALGPVLLGVTAVLGGLIGFINTWSFPTAFGVIWLTLVFAPGRPDWLPFGSRGSQKRWIRREFRRVGGALLIVGALVPIGVAVVLPFWLGSVTSREIALVSGHTPLVQLLLVHGGFLFVFAVMVYTSLTSTLGRRPIAWGVVGGLLIGGWVWLQLPALVMIGPIALGAWICLRLETDENTADGRSIGYPAVLVLAGAGIVLLVEIVYLRDQAAPGRYNTVFKAYSQVWVLWSPAAGVGLAQFLRRRPGFRGRLGRLLAVCLIVSTSIYGPLALSNHFTGRAPSDTIEDPTLDAWTQLEAVHPKETAAIRWLDQRSGRPVVAAAPGTDAYSWSNPESSFTGLPTIAGWVHEVVYRNASVYNARVADVKTIYQGPPNRTVALLKRYDVRYIYVGPRERKRYGNPTFDRIDGLSKHRFGAVTIYEVNDSLADSSNTATPEFLYRIE